MKITISNISRLAGVNRNVVYRELCKKYKCTNSTLPVLTVKDRDEIVKKYKTKKKEIKKAIVDTTSVVPISIVPLPKDTNSLKKRLEDAKEQYDWNAKLIDNLKKEIEVFKSTNNTHAMNGGNGMIQVPPQLKSLESYQKLQISLNKVISELEEKLDLIADNESKVNPFE